MGIRHGLDACIEDVKTYQLYLARQSPLCRIQPILKSTHWSYYTSHYSNFYPWEFFKLVTTTWLGFLLFQWEYFHWLSLVAAGSEILLIFEMQSKATYLWELVAFHSSGQCNQGGSILLMMIMLYVQLDFLPTKNKLPLHCSVSVVPATLVWDCDPPTDRLNGIDTFKSYLVVSKYCTAQNSTWGI